MCSPSARIPPPQPARPASANSSSAFAWSSSASLVLVPVLALDNAEGTVQELRPGVWRRVAWH